MKSKLSIISFISGLISLVPILIWILPSDNPLELFVIYFFLYTFYTSPIGIITGVISLFIIFKNKLEGVWFAILGILFSIAGASIIILFLIGLSEYSLFT